MPSNCIISSFLSGHKCTLHSPQCGYAIKKAFTENVLLCQRREKQVVIKKMNLLNPSERNSAKREIQAGKILEHPNIIKLRESFEESSEQMCLVFDYVEGKDLLTFMEDRNFEPLSETHSKTIIKQLISALLYSHSKGISHLDVKLENCMITHDNHITLIDFGLCEFGTNPNGLSEAWHGSQDYLPPEIMLRTPYLTQKADVYSLGVVLYILLNGQLPHSFADKMKYLRAVRKLPPLQFTVKTLSPEAKDLLAKMLASDPANRITLTEVNNHKWFSM